MTKMPAIEDRNVAPRGQAVRRPRAVDGIGSALRAAFNNDPGGLPADMRALLCMIETGARNRPS